MNFSAILTTALLVLIAPASAFTTPVSFNVKSVVSQSTARKMMDVDPIQVGNMVDMFKNSMPSTILSDAALAETAAQAMEPTYSKASYYTTLGLYIMSFPGIWSQIKRSTSAKVKRKTFLGDGEAVDGGKDLRQQAGEIMAFMKANNYEVVEAGEVITFRGLVQKSTSQAFFLAFCTLLGMASLALVLQTQFQDFALPVIGKVNWFYLCLLSPYAGIYYWRSGDRVDDIQVKLTSNDEDTENEISIEGNDDEIERMWRALELREKGMIKVEGLLESA